MRDHCILRKIRSLDSSWADEWCSSRHSLRMEKVKSNTQQSVGSFVVSIFKSQPWVDFCVISIIQINTCTHFWQFDWGRKKHSVKKRSRNEAMLWHGVWLYPPHSSWNRIQPCLDVMCSEDNHRDKDVTVKWTYHPDISKWRTNVRMLLQSSLLQWGRAQKIISANPGCDKWKKEKYHNSVITKEVKCYSQNLK